MRNEKAKRHKGTKGLTTDFTDGHGFPIVNASRKDRKEAQRARARQGKREEGRVESGEWRVNWIKITMAPGARG